MGIRAYFFRRGQILRSEDELLTLEQLQKYIARGQNVGISVLGVVDGGEDGGEDEEETR